MKAQITFDRGWFPEHLPAGWLLFSTLILSAAWARAAEAGVQAWVQRYSHVIDSDDGARKVVADIAGNVIVAGYTHDGITGADMLVIKYSSAGVPLWTNRYNGPGNSHDQARAVALDSSGNVFVTGPSATIATEPYNYDYVTIKYSGAGVPLWTNRYNAPGNGDDYASAIAVDGSGNVVVTGYSGSGSGSFDDYVTIAYSGAGVPLWTNRYNGPGNYVDQANAVAVDGSGNVFVTGYSVDSNGSYNYATIKYSGAGVPLWTNRHPFGRASAVAVDGSGNVVVTGFDSDYTTIKYSGAGVPLWTNRYNGPGNSGDVAFGAAVDGSGNVVVTGTSFGSDGSLDYATIAYSGSGVPLWTNRYNGPGNYGDQANAVAVDGSGNVFVTGASVDGGSFYDYVTIKYSGSGVPLWTNRYNGPSNGADHANALAVDESGSVFVTGNSWGNGSSDDYATIKYSESGVPLWTNRYNGPGNSDDQARAVAVDGSGNVFVTGTSGIYNFRDYATIAYSVAGVPLWTNRYDGPGNDIDEASALAVDGSGNVVVTGSSVGSGGSYDYATIKYSGAGVPLWTNRYALSQAQARAVAVDGSGNVFVTGSSRGVDSGIDYVTIAYSGAGVPLWTNRYDGPVNSLDAAQAAAVDGGGNVFVTGFSYGGDSRNDYATIAYSASGVPLWTNRYSGPGANFDEARAVAVDNSGNVFVTGSSEDSGSSADYATIKYSGAGVPLWTNRYNGPGNGHDRAEAAAVDGSGNVFVTGHSTGSNGSLEYATIKYSDAGVPLWTNRYPSGYAQAVVVDGSGNVFVTGTSFGSGSFDYATIKYSSAGVPLWTNRYNGPVNGNDSLLGKQSLALGPDGSVYVTGASDADYTGNTISDFATIRYISLPLLAIEHSAANVSVFWPSAFSDFILQQNTSGIATENWSNVTDIIQDNGTNRTLTVNPPTGNRFYRLFKP